MGDGLVGAIRTPPLSHGPRRLCEFSKGPDPLAAGAASAELVLSVKDRGARGQNRGHRPARKPKLDKLAKHAAPYNP